MIFSFQPFAAGMSLSSLRPAWLIHPAPGSCEPADCLPLCRPVRSPTGCLPGDQSSGDGSRVERHRFAQSPTHDALRRDPEHLWIKAPPEFGAAGVQDLRLASYLDAPDTPGLTAGSRRSLAMRHMSGS